MNRKPNLFIIGAPKCGTTTMYHFLGKHPNVFTSKIKEPHYFNTDSNHRYFFKEKDYLNLFSEATKMHLYNCEASVWYLYSEKAIENILNFNKDAKFLILLRNPVSMFFSLHRELIFGGSETETDPVKAWQLQKERKEGRSVPKSATAPELLQYGDACKLGAQVATIINLIPKENLKCLLLEDLKNNPEATYFSVLEFLDLPKVKLKSYEPVNVRKARKSKELATVIAQIAHFKRALGIKKGVGIGNRINSYNVTHKVDEMDQSPEFITELNNYFHTDIDLLGKLINRDLSHWKYKLEV
ncbi:sulfotransferase domain-containing protein [Ulvibacter sp. MAR_2010_11]|nr:sulfotransferase domain-containing protein [Ulvibacter sp. MAR_2010_11]